MVYNMITLYEDNEVTFQTNGLGSLRDATKCTVTEEANGEYELSMEYPINGKHFSDIVLRRIIFVKPDPYRSPQPFRIYDISKPLNGVIQISAHHISYDLSGYPIAAFSASNLDGVFSQLNSQMGKAFNKNKQPFIFERNSDKTNVSTEFTLVTPCSARALLGGNEGSVLDVYHGEYEWDRWTVRLYNHRGANHGVRIAYGKNLTQLQQDESCEDVWTGVYPYWYSENEEGAILVELSTSDSGKVLYCQGMYKHERIMVLDLSSEFSEQPTPEQLRTRAQQYIDDNKIGVPKINLSVSFANLADTANYLNLKILETVSLWDEVNVEFPELGVSTTATVITTEYNALTDKYSQIQLGDAKNNLATTIASQGLEVQKAIYNASTFYVRVANVESGTQNLNKRVGIVEGGLESVDTSTKELDGRVSNVESGLGTVSADLANAVVVSDGYSNSFETLFTNKLEQMSSVGSTSVTVVTNVTVDELGELVLTKARINITDGIITSIMNNV